MPRREPRIDGLTRRQRQVLAAVALTGNREEAAAWLGLSPWTVRGHMADIFDATGALDLVSALRAVGWLRVPVGAWPPGPYPFGHPPPRTRGWRRLRPVDSGAPGDP